jgi:glycosyltransferase involved in cell wall biosynthesis
VENGETGLLVEQSEFEELANKAIFLLENQDAAQEIIDKACQQVLKYSRERVCREWHNCYFGFFKTIK